MAYRYRIVKLVYYTLCYVDKNISQDIPSFVLERLKPHKVSLIEQRIFDLIVKGKSIENVRFLFTVLAMNSLSDKVKFLREIVFPSVKVLKAKYNFSSNKYILYRYIIHFRIILVSSFRLSKLFLARIS
jgi:hypothetical protein